MLWTTLFLWSVQYTVLAHAYILFTMQAPIIVLSRVLLRKHVARRELQATIVTFIGTIIINFDSKAEKADPSSTNILFGNSIALLSGIFGVFTVLTSKELTKHVPPRQMTLAQNFSLVIVQFLFFLLPFKGITLGAHPTTGFFGWGQPSNFLYTFFVMGVMCRSVTFIAYTLAIKTFSTVIVTNVFMTEPLISQVLGILLGIDKLPGFITFFGLIVTCCGLIVLSSSVSKSNNRTDY